MTAAMPMPTEDFITDLFCRVDAKMVGVAKDPRAELWPGEVVTIGLLFAIKGVEGRGRSTAGCGGTGGGRSPACRSGRGCSAGRPTTAGGPTGSWPSRPRSGHVRATFGPRSGWPTPFGIELIHPCREGRSEDQLGRKGLSNHRWIDGGKLGAVLNGRGEVVAWDAAAKASAYDGRAVRQMVAAFDGRMIVLADGGFHLSDANGGDPPNPQLCRRKTWGERIVIETMFSMLTTVCHFKHMAHRCWRHFEAHLGYGMAAFNVLVTWDGLELGDDGKYHPSIARFSL